MNIGRYIAVALLCAVAVGCRSKNKNNELLQNEMRLYEDEIYRLQDELAAYKSQLAACQGGNLVHPGPDLPGGIESAPIYEPPTDPVPAAPQFEVPLIRPPREDTPEGTMPEPARARKPETGNPPAESKPSGTPADPTSLARNRGLPPEFEVPPLEQPPLGMPGDGVIHQITVHDLLTGGLDRDRQYGDEGLLVILEPRDMQGRIIHSAGNISIALMDPALPGDAGRVARWDFSANDAAQLYRRTAAAEGIFLELAWPAGPPAHRDLTLHARLVTPDGREFRCEKQIRIDLATQQGPSWTEPLPIQNTRRIRASHAPPAGHQRRFLR